MGLFDLCVRQLLSKTSDQLSSKQVETIETLSPQVDALRKAYATLSEVFVEEIGMRQCPLRQRLSLYLPAACVTARCGAPHDRFGTHYVDVSDNLRTECRSLRGQITALAQV